MSLCLGPAVFEDFDVSGLHLARELPSKTCSVPKVAEASAILGHKIFKIALDL